VAEELRSFRHGAAGLALLHLNGEAYTQKPPLYFWAAALMGVPGGRVTEAAARLPSALCGLATVWLLVHFGSRLLGPRSGAIAGALLLTAFEFAHRARRVQLDVMLTLLELIALTAFWRLQRGSLHRARDLAAMHAALGLAVLTKGPVGLVVPLLAIAAYLAQERRWGELRGMLPPWALLLSLGPGIAWIAVALSFAPSGTFEEAVVTNLFGRFFAGTSHARPLFYFVYQFPVNFLPWTLLWPLAGWFAVRRVFGCDGDPGRRRAWLFLLTWVGVSFAFFSLSSGKRGLYLLPAFPAAALLCADAVAVTLSEGRDLSRRAVRALAAAALAIPALGLAAVLRGEIAGVAIPASFGAALATTSGLAALAWRSAGRSCLPGLARFGITAAAVLAIELATFALAFPALDPQKSPRPIAESASALTVPGERVGLASGSALLGGLVYYADRPVTLLGGPEAVRDFLRSNGRVIVVPEAKLSTVTQVTPVVIRSRFRRGERALLVVSATSPKPAVRGSRRRTGSRPAPRSAGAGHSTWAAALRRRPTPAAGAAARSGSRDRCPAPVSRARPRGGTRPSSW
jgi:4-amino-4-deoxy-L-arabinose transferase-like glycosyltransferase